MNRWGNKRKIKSVFGVQVFFSLCWVIFSTFKVVVLVMVVVAVVAALFCCSGGYVHVGVLCCQGRYGDLVEKELSLVWTNGRVQLIDGLTPVVLLTQLLQNLIRSRTDTDGNGLETKVDCFLTLS